MPAADDVPAALAPHLRTLLDAAGSGRPARFYVVADSGCGKTLLLSQAAAALNDLGYLTLFVTATEPAYGTDDTSGGLARLMADKAACRLLISAMGDDIARTRAFDHHAGRAGRGSTVGAADARAELRSRVEAARITEAPGLLLGEASASIVVRDSPGTVVSGSGSITPAVDQVAQLMADITRMSQNLSSVLHGVSERIPLAIVVDDVHTLRGTRVEPWLTQVLAGVPRALVIRGARPAPGRAAVAERGREIRLMPMTPAECSAHTVRALTAVGWPRYRAERAAATVYEVTRGHPIAVVTCCEILAAADSAERDPGTIRSLLTGADPHWGAAGAIATVRDHVDRSAQALLGRPVELFDQLVVMRRCRLPLLAAVLREQGVLEEDAGRLHDWLTQRAFTTLFDDDPDEGWRLHDYLREHAERLLAAEEPSRYRQLHATVERYYRGVLNFDDRAAYADGQRHEDPAWQRESLEWLHHAARLDRRDFPSVRNAMIRLFLDAFWWWDAEIPSTYCGELLAAYRALPARLDLEWVDWLADFRTSYVPGQGNQIPGRDVARWEKAGAALNKLCAKLDLKRESDPTDPDLRRIHAITCFLRGDIAWYGSDGSDGSRTRAAAWYRACARTCTEPASHWIATWARWAEATLWVEVDPAHARTLAAGLQERIEEDGDRELLVYLITLYAELAWREGRPDDAFDLHTRAVLHAFVYQIRQELLRQAPSAYSHSVLRSTVARAEACFAAAGEAGLHDAVARAAARGRAYFAPYWLHQGLPPDHPHGFPPGPAPEDLGSTRTRYADDVQWVIDAMEVELGAPLEDPLRTSPLERGEGDDGTPVGRRPPP
ncbi:hypothetical protein [Streptomyces chumphonensis]|uniref:hypothetical protein n=1 Tax=Streptomyces chumphonensis TaxID=1214925 RepID=UPI003D7089F6